MLLQCKLYRWNLHLREVNLMDLLVILMIAVCVYITGLSNLSFSLLIILWHTMISKRGSNLCRSDCSVLFEIYQSFVTCATDIFQIIRYISQCHWKVFRIMDSWKLSARKSETQTSTAIVTPTESICGASKLVCTCTKWTKQLGHVTYWVSDKI